MWTDLTCFTPASAAALVEALRGEIQLLVHLGDCWIYGHPTVSPVTEETPRQPLGEYGLRKPD